MKIPSSLWSRYAPPKTIGATRPPKPILSQNKSIFERIIRIDPQLIATNDMGFSLDFRNNGGIWTERSLFDNSAAELAANDTFDDDSFIHLNLSAPMVNRQ